MSKRNKNSEANTEITQVSGAEVVETTESVVMPVVQGPVNGIDLDLVFSTCPPSKRGISNLQMIPAMKTALDNGEVDVLIALKQAYGPVFESTKKYIGSKRRAKLDAMGDLTAVAPIVEEEHAVAQVG